MKKHGWAVTALEPDEDARARSRSLYGLELKPLEALFQLEKSSYDAITLWHVLEHVHDLHETVQQLSSLLKKDGRLFIAVPNFTSYEAGVYKEHWAAYDVPRHLYHFSPQSMHRLASSHGLVIEALRPMWYDSFYISLLSSRYRSGRANWPASAWNGMISNMKAISNAGNCSSVIYVMRTA
jgi:SAM-dependent methyltransferase